MKDVISLEELRSRCFNHMMAQYPSSDKTFDSEGLVLQGEDIYKMSINFSKTAMFSEVETLEVLEFPGDAKNVKYDHNIKLKPHVKIYSVWFTPAFYREGLDPIPEGISILPLKVDEFRFSKVQQIVTSIHLDKIRDLKNSDPESLKKYLDDLTKEYTDSLNAVVEGSAKRNVPIYGNIMLRITKDSYEEVESYVRKTELKDSFIKFDP